MRSWLIGILALGFATAAAAQTPGGDVTPPCDDRGGQIVGVGAMGAQLPNGTLSGSGE